MLCRTTAYIFPFRLTPLLMFFSLNYLITRTYSFSPLLLTPQKNHSALNASIGLMRAALRAGISPASVPATIITTVAATQTSMPTVGL